MITSRLTRTEHGDPKLTITVIGTHEVMRFALHQLSGQIEFGELGRLKLRALRRQLGAAIFNRNLRYLCGSDETLYRQIRRAFR